MRKTILFAALAVPLAACQSTRQVAALPSGHQIIRDQLVIVSDLELPKRHRLLDELVASREDLCARLNLPPSDEPIHVFLFQGEDAYRSYVGENFAGFPERRAIFVQDDTSLNVYAYWGQRVAEDLRHEVTHGYLHSVVPNIPLWLDEGLAEYFEVGRGRRGRNQAHLVTLAAKLKEPEWRPDLARLERLQNGNEMSQLDYAESWLWTHFLLETPTSLPLLQDYLDRLRASGEVEPFKPLADKLLPDATNQIMEYLRELAQVNANPGRGFATTATATQLNE